MEKDDESPLRRKRTKKLKRTPHIASLGSSEDRQTSTLPRNKSTFVPLSLSIDFKGSTTAFAFSACYFQAFISLPEPAVSSSPKLSNSQFAGRTVTFSAYFFRHYSPTCTSSLRPINPHPRSCLLSRCLVHSSTPGTGSSPVIQVLRSKNAI